MNSTEKIKDMESFYRNYYENLENEIQSKIFEEDYFSKLLSLFNNYSLEIKCFLDNLTSIEYLSQIIDDYKYNLSNIYKDEISNRINNLSFPINNLMNIYENNSYIISNKEEIINIIFGEINELKYWINYNKESSYDKFKQNLFDIINNKFKIFKKINKNVWNYILSYLNNEDYLINEIIFINRTFDEIENIFEDYTKILEINLDNITKGININESNDYNIISEIEYLANIFISSINNSNNTQNNSLEKEFLNEIKIKREIERIKKIIFNNDYTIDLSHKLIPGINIDNIKLFYENIKLNITNEAYKTINKYILPESNEIYTNYSQEILDEIDNLYKDQNESYFIINNFKELLPDIDGNFDEEIEKDLNELFSQLFDLIDLSSQYNNNKINFENEKKKYYNKINQYFNIDIKNKEIEYQNENGLKNILLILIKRIKEKQNLQIKENLKNIYKDYEILGNDYSNSRVIKMFNRIQNEKILSTYLNIFNEINNETFDLPDFNKNKTSKENIKNITKNLYEKHFNDFKKKYAKFENYIDEKNNETINKIENEIDNILKKIKNVIENSLNEVQNINLNGQYLKRHILNFCDNKIYLKLSNNYTIDKIIDNHVILENIKYIEDNIYSNKITDILNENFKLSLNDYFENYYKYEVVNYITWIYEYYYKNMMIYTDNLVKNKTNYLCMMIKNSKKLKLDNYTYEQIINLHNELDDIFFENTIKIDDTFYSDNEFMRNKHILIKTYLNIVGNNDFLKSLSLTDNYKNLFKYNDTIYEL